MIEINATAVCVCVCVYVCVRAHTRTCMHLYVLVHVLVQMKCSNTICMYLKFAHYIPICFSIACFNADLQLSC